MIVRLAGGFGNQTFQFGAALYLSRIRNQENFYLDSSALSSYQVKREFVLDSFFDLGKSNAFVKKNFLTKLRLPVYLTLPFVYWPLIGDQNFNYVNKCVLSFPVLMDGYFQNLSQKNFNDIYTLLKSLLLDKFKKLDTVDSRTCVIHIRGGDFIDLGWNKFTSKEYYVLSMKVMTDKYDVSNFRVVTDDILYARSILPLKEFDIKIASCDIVNDFQTIAAHSKRILSASTFALWASALGVNDDGGVVIAPNEFTPGIKRGFLLPNEERSNA
tara:strand:- start:620 stop:1432 length:813 start_codon:yes stop_codon:yes gene_type:complete